MSELTDSPYDTREPSPPYNDQLKLINQLMQKLAESATLLGNWRSEYEQQINQLNERIKSYQLKLVDNNSKASQLRLENHQLKLKLLRISELSQSEYQTRGQSRVGKRFITLE